MSRKDNPEKETPAALQAYHAFYDMGPGRSLDGLLFQFKRMELDYQEWAQRPEGDPCASPLRPATTSETTLKRWSSAFRWADKAGEQAQREADAASQKNIEDLAKRKRSRSLEAQAMRTAGGRLLQEFLRRITTDEQALKNIPLTGRLVTPEQGKAYREVGLTDLLPMATRAVVYGHKLERTETGENQDERFDGFVKRFVERLTEGSTPEEKVAVQAMAFRITREEDDA